MTGTDRDRELKPRGRQQAEFLALTLATLDTPPDRLIASPFVRTQQTAEIIDARLNLGLITDDRLRCGTQSSAVLNLIAEHADARSLVIVGHNPTFDELVGLLTRGPGAYGPGLRTGEAYVLEIDPTNPLAQGAHATVLAQIRHENEEPTAPEA